MSSLRDALLVARFTLARAVRTKSALALCLLYLLASTGATYVFTRILLQIENETADLLSVPRVTKPGAMLDTLRENGNLESMVNGLVSRPDLAEWAMDQPILTLVHFWFALGVLPFLAVALGAEAIAPDARDRSIRFELVRTGRLELVSGRLAGQAVLLGAGALGAVAGTWCVAMFGMVDQPALRQVATLLEATPRLWLWSLPFLGLGVAASQLTSTVNVARSLALFAAVLTWIGWGWLNSDLMADWPILKAVLEPALPQTYVLDLWGPGLAWASSGAVLPLLGFVAALLPWPIFARRNL